MCIAHLGHLQSMDQSDCSAATTADKRTLLPLMIPGLMCKSIRLRQRGQTLRLSGQGIEPVGFIKAP